MAPQSKVIFERTVTKRAGNDTNFGSQGAPRADLHRNPPSTMGHESLIQGRPSLSHPGGLKYFFSDIQAVTLNYHTPRHIKSGAFPMEVNCPM